MINADGARQFRPGPAMVYFSCAGGGLGGALFFWVAAALPRMNWLMPTFTGQPRSAACHLMLAIWTHDRANTHQHGQADKKGKAFPKLTSLVSDPAAVWVRTTVSAPCCPAKGETLDIASGTAL